MIEVKKRRFYGLPLKEKWIGEEKKRGRKGEEKNLIIMLMTVISVLPSVVCLAVRH